MTATPTQWGSDAPNDQQTGPLDRVITDAIDTDFTSLDTSITAIAALPQASNRLVAISRSLIQSFSDLHAVIPTMSAEELFATWHEAAYLGKQAWLVQAHVLWQAKSRKVHQNDGGIRTVASLFGISPSNASALIRIWEEFGGDFLSRRAPLDSLIGVSWYKTVAYAPDPQTWLTYAVEQKQANPDYSVRDLQADIARGLVDDNRATPARQAPRPVGPEAPTVIRASDPDRAPEDAPPARPPTPLRATQTALPGADALAIQYLTTVEMLASALDGTDQLFFRTDPAELVARLPALTEDDALTQGLLRQAFDVLGRVFALRDAQGQSKARRRSNGAASA